ncbi:MAG: [FeFe] hydrogenase H-cluster maturation GTPase HydF [Bacteroidetes bacterium GWA2_30_7]|nr:MAG: [FeFe] hydrogenase H-cluster maturation GTPase HydF [Bacteroidetes bacterium GWA2_30_7]
MKGKDLKPHIGIFGRRNNGKSSFINTLVNQEIAIVSSIPGTTTDPVKKSIEIFGIGPVIMIDTAGIDDVGELGAKRIEKTREVIKTVDLAILLIVDNIFDEFEINLINEFNYYETPFVIIHNKSDIEKININTLKKIQNISKNKVLNFNSLEPENLDEVIELLKNTIPTTSFQKPSLLKGLITKNDIVLLITPVDSEAPDGRMILPQQMAIRDVLDNDCVNIVLKETELETFLKNTGIKPKLVITDSQAFGFVSKIIPEDIMLTGFSIVFARLKGNFQDYINGTSHLSKLKDGDKVLILESCTHQVSCDDIGRAKIPKWLDKFTGKKLEYKVVGGLDSLKDTIKDFAIVIQCGGCVTTRKQIVNRLKPAIDARIPVTNYGMAIAYINGIFDRAIAPFINKTIEL